MEKKTPICRIVQGKLLICLFITIDLMSNYAHLISLNVVHQVAECWQTAESDHGLALLTAQPFHFGQGHPSQDNLFTSQEVLELRVIRQLTGKSEISVVTKSDLSEKHQPLKIL